MKEILFQLDSSLPASLQAQLREKIVNAILSRALQPGERLPSSRSLSKHLNIARNTVTLAYQALADDGYLDAKARSGYVVNEDAPVNPLGFVDSKKQLTEKIDWSHRIHPLAADARFARKPFNWREYEYPFVYGQADFNLFSHSEIYKVPEHVLVTLGAQNALFLVAELMIGPNTVVGLEEPNYPDIRNIVRNKTSKIEYLTVDENGLVLDEEKLARCDVIFITPSHQCPTTVTMPIARRKRLMELADKHDFVIVEDDYEFEMNFLAAPSPALKSLDEKARVVYIGSFSKSLFPGLRLGYLAGPDALINEARHLRHLMFRHPPGHSQRTAAYFMALGHYGSQMRKLKKTYAERHAVMSAALKTYGLINASAASFGGTSFWIKGPEWLDTDILANNLLEESVIIEAGSAFFAKINLAKNYFRIAYSSIPTNKIEPGIEKIANAIEKLK